MTNRKHGLTASLTALGMLLTAGTALAQGDGEGTSSGDVDVDVDVDAPSASVSTDPDGSLDVDVDRGDVDVDADVDRPRGMGFSVTAGVGTGGFTNETMRNATEVGGNWALRVTIGTNLPFAVEASYIGSAQYLDTTPGFFNNDALLIGNGAQGVLRVNVLPGRKFTPFVFGGAAWRHYSLTALDFNESNFDDDDDVLEIPVGGGLSFRSGGLILDLRGEFRLSVKEDLVPADDADDGSHAPMNRWGASFNAGKAF